MNEAIPIYVDDSNGASCFLSLQSSEEKLIHPNNAIYSLGIIPTIFKIDGSILEYFQDRKRFIQKHQSNNLEKDKTALEKSPPSLTLSIQLSLLHISKSTIRTVAEGLIKDINSCLEELGRGNNSIAIPKFIESIFHRQFVKDKDIKAALKQYYHEVIHLLLLPFESIVLKETLTEDGGMIQCDQKVLLSAIKIYQNHFDLQGIEQVQNQCLIYIIAFLATKGSVQSVAITSAPEVLNFEARGRLQSGYMGIEPYTAAGLTGYGQICGVADSGLDDLSTFFIDTSNAYKTIPTARDGSVETDRRKVIQYTAYADGCDEQGGHGTHVVGSIAGLSVNGEFENMHGMARDAKIAFYDLGVTESSTLKVPALADLFQSAYQAGARVHTNSWGTIGGMYGPLSYDVDDYLYHHPDFLVVFAAGNAGSFGLRTINSPANAKNVLTIGAGQVKHFYLQFGLRSFFSLVAWN